MEHRIIKPKKMANMRFGNPNLSAKRLGHYVDVVFPAKITSKKLNENQDAIHSLRSIA